MNLSQICKRCNEKIDGVGWYSNDDWYHLECWDQSLFDRLQARDAVFSDLLTACKRLIEYRDSAGPLNFQLEKADDFMKLMRVAIAAARGNR